MSVAIEENRYSTVEGGEVEVCVTAENTGDEDVEAIVGVHIEGKFWSFLVTLYCVKPTLARHSIPLATDENYRI